MMAADVEKFHFRLVLLGSNGTGKTSILNRFLFKKFETKYKPTVEDLFTKEFDLGNIEIKVDFLDTSGSMQFPAMRRLSITTGSAFLIVYALDDEASYEVVKMCVAEIQEIRPDYQEIPIVFAGNKCDVPREMRKVFKETVSNYVHYELPRLRAKVIECSCRDSINIDNIFRAYLSLAKVSLSSAVSASLRCKQPLQKLTPTDSPTATKEGDSNLLGTNRRSSSMKVVLGERKSCDASILSAIKRTTPTGQEESGYGAGATRQLRTASFVGHHHDQAGTTTGDKKDQQQQQQQQQSISANVEEDQIDLETAIQSKLTVSGNQRAKPRSRSLIWRPSRRSRTAVEQSDCRVS